MEMTVALASSHDCRIVGETLGRVGEKWTILVVMALRDAPLRFNEIRRRVGGISQQMLARTLKELERDGLIAREVLGTKPPHALYSLSELGQSLLLAIRPLAQWTQSNIHTIVATRAEFDSIVGISD